MAKKIILIMMFLLLISFASARNPGDEPDCAVGALDFCDNFDDDFVDDAVWYSMNGGLDKCDEKDGYMVCGGMADNENVFLNWSILANAGLTWSAEIKIEINGTDHDSAALWLEDETPSWDDKLYCNAFDAATRQIKCKAGSPAVAWDGSANLTFRWILNDTGKPTVLVYNASNFLIYNNSDNTNYSAFDSSIGWHFGQATKGGGFRVHYYAVCMNFVNFSSCLTVNPPNIALNSPANNSVINISWALLNATVSDADADTSTILIFANNNPFGLNLSEGLVSIQENVVSGSEINYNLTALPVKPDEVNLTLLYHFDNRSEFGENNSLVYDFAGRGINLSSGFPPTWNATGGKFAGGFEFDGVNDRLANTLVKFNGHITPAVGTIELWIKPRSNIFSTPNVFDLPAIVTDSGQDLGIYIGKNSSGHNRIWIYNFNNNVDKIGIIYNVDEWVHIAWVHNGTDLLGYKNGIFVDSTLSGNSTGISVTTLIIGSNNGVPTRHFNGTMDELAIYNRSLSAQEIRSHYNLADDTYYWKVNATDATGLSNESENWQFTINQSPIITFINQTPFDINAFNLLGSEVNISYNIIDNDDINTSTVKLYHKINDTDSSIVFFINGSGTSEFIEKDFDSVDLNNYLWNVPGDDVYPATYNLEPFSMYATDHLQENLGSNSEMLKIRFFNVSSSEPFSFLSLYIENATATTTPSAIFYCNSSYTSGNPNINSNCVNFFNLDASQGFNHSHSNNSFHVTIPFSMNETTGTIGDVTITPLSYFILRGSAVGSWNVFYVPNISRTDTTQISGNTGNTWSNFAGTIDAHLHQYCETEIFYYFAGACDINNNCINSTQLNESIDALGLPPTAPDITNPDNNTFKLILNITWTASLSPQDDDFYYNISLLNTDFSFNQTIKNNNSVNLTVLFNTETVTNGRYIIRVTAIDNGSRSSSGFSENFGIDNIDPEFILIFPNPNNSTVAFNGTDFTFRINASDETNIFSVNVTCTNHSDFIGNIFQTSFEYINTTQFAPGNQQCQAEVCDTHTFKSIPDFDVTYDTNSRWIEFDDLKLITKEDLVGITYEKKVDRYSFCFETNIKENYLTVTIPNGCIEVPDSKYAGHHVCGDYWLDFDGYNADVSGKTVTIDTSKEESRNICFNSVGKLNCVTQDFNFSIIADTEAPIINNIEPLNNSFSNTASTEFSFTITDNTLDNIDCNLRLSLNSANETTNGSLTVTNGSISTFPAIDLSTGKWKWNVNCTDFAGNSGVSETFDLRVVVPVQLFSVTECPTDTSGSLLLILFFAVSFAFMVIGFVFRIGVIGFFGAMILMVLSWYISPCIIILGFILGAFSLFLMIWFVINGLGFNNTTFQ